MGSLILSDYSPLSGAQSIPSPSWKFHSYTLISLLPLTSDVMAPNATTYRCDECGKDINRKCDLDRHMKLHASNIEDLKIPCPYPDCNYKTLQCSNLKTHMYTHTGERPLKCPDEGCGYDTRDPGGLTKHRQKKHGYVPRENTGKKCKSRIGATRTTQQQTRFTPYSASLRPSRSTVTTEVPPQFPLDDGCPASSDVGASERAQVLKNNALAFETELALQFARASGFYLETSLDQLGPSSLVPLTEPEVHTADDLERQNVFTFDQHDELSAQPTTQSAIDADFERFLAQYSEYPPKATSAHDAAPLPLTELDIFTPTVSQPLVQSADELLERFLASDDEHMVKTSSLHNPISTPNPDTAIPTTFRVPTWNTIDDALLMSAMLQQHQYDRVDNSSYDSYAQPTSCDAGHARYDSFTQGAPTNMGVHPKTVTSQFFNDPTYSYAAPADPGAFHWQGMENFYGF
ncbi:hypothetical protein JVU11DRAFT_8063 [Chiua virens]|nr:hypothetical protein JVU11DRAFT_8063 [Chiua virens]